MVCEDLLSLGPFTPCPLPRLSALQCGTCVLGATLGTRSRRHGLPSKAFKGVKSNRCILYTVPSNHLQPPVLCGPLSPPPTEEALPGHTNEPLLFGRQGRAVTAPAPVSGLSRGLLGRGRRGRAGMRAAGRTRPSGRAPWNPDSLSGNRRRTREERVEHEEAGGLLRAEASADTIREGGCERWRAGGGGRLCCGVRVGRGFWPVDQSRFP